MRIRVTGIKTMWLRRVAIAALFPFLFLITFPLAIIMNVMHLWSTAVVAWTQRVEPRRICEVGLVGDSILINMPIDLLAHVANLAPCIHRADPDGGDVDFHVTDPKLFAREVTRTLLNETDESGTTLVHELFDDAIENVIDNGGEGFAWPSQGIHG